jgi:hypothetical protein
MLLEKDLETLPKSQEVSMQSDIPAEHREHQPDVHHREIGVTR